MYVLLVDDSASIRSLTKTLLAAAGITDTGEAENGKVALAQVASRKPDLVFTDWNMPEMNGIDLIRALRAQSYSGPIVMMTTEKEKERVVEAVRAGVNNYIVKPFKRDEFYKRLADTLAKAGLPVPAMPVAA